MAHAPGLAVAASGRRPRAGSGASGAISSCGPDRPAGCSASQESARSYLLRRGRTPCLAVVPSCARSYLRAPGGYDFAGSGTTSRPRVRPRGLGYDCAGPGTTSRPRVRPRGPGYDRAGPGTTSRPRVRPRGPGYDRAGPGTTARSSRTDRRPPHSAPTHSAPTGSRLAAARSVTTFAQSCRRGVVACTRRPHPARHGRPPPVRRPASRSIVEQGPYSTYRARIPNPDS